MKQLSFTLGLLAAAAGVASHATFQESWHGTTDDAESCVRMPASNSPVTDVTSKDLACNVGTKPAAKICSATGGQPFSVEMHQQPGDRACGTQAIGGNHFGPVMVYMSKVDDAAAADGSGDWFKVDEFGYAGDDGGGGNKTWGTDLLNANCGRRTFVVPRRIPGGAYLVRAEAIALHAAAQVGGAQFYMSCYQVNVTTAAADGGGQLPAGVKIPGAYRATDPGIQIDIWASSFKTYEIPGPAVIDASFF